MTRRRGSEGLEANTRVRPFDTALPEDQLHSASRVPLGSGDLDCGSALVGECVYAVSQQIDLPGLGTQIRRGAMHGHRGGPRGLEHAGVVFPFAQING